MYRIVPAGVAVPRGVDDLQGIVRGAAESGPALEPRGSGSVMPGNAVGRGVLVDLSQGFQWMAPDWERRRVWAGASVTCAQLNDAARPFGLRLPPEPSSAAFATVGGMVATNAAGPRSVRAGSVRGWIEAIEVLAEDGAVRRIRRGGGPGRFGLDGRQQALARERFPRTRKNSGGDALDRFAEPGDELDLFVGSEGTVGIVTAVQWRLEPVPPDVAGAERGLPPPGRAPPAAAPPLA